MALFPRGWLGLLVVLSMGVACMAQDEPSGTPSAAPSSSPVAPTTVPVVSPSPKPTVAPTLAPITVAPTQAPTLAPTPVTPKPVVTLAPEPSTAAPAPSTAAPSITTPTKISVVPITIPPIKTVSSASSAASETPTTTAEPVASLTSSTTGSSNTTEPSTKKKASGSGSGASTSSEGFFSSGNWQMWAAVIGGLAVVGGIVAAVVMKANSGGDDDYPDLDSPPPAAPTGKPVSPVRPFNAAPPTKFEPMSNHNNSMFGKPLPPPQQASFYAEAPPTDIARKANAMGGNVTFTYNEPRVSTLPILERRNSMNLTRFSDGSDVMQIGGKSHRSSSASSAGWVDEPPRMDDRESENFLATSGDSRVSYASTTFDIDRADSEASIVRYSSQYSEYSIDDRGTEAGGDRDSYEL
ncbi:hypothetical protein SPRG_08137 [Saprolegnia parasitica CBS 223.65]|uniref:Uncharacterized protein n=1 Tax=Saprolegnia parasitica (strain CBS 223.65) TaxID=695850 RepID=A0A067CJY2_SAPPC|nr:hypothetical protein SPRG_08137 [Saprolegnia parasitica CBS 223.65]KDO26846.1 hypothetical protein SPRG_08137 [Saprolegnia parasitica CBS 223.65]|eukprot:XP_012202492.1 hypothetical protein SPRG_08137 [Saprolegnia parasitica CBS 223.65]